MQVAQSWNDTAKTYLRGLPLMSLFLLSPSALTLPRVPHQIWPVWIHIPSHPFFTPKAEFWIYRSLFCFSTYETLESSLTVIIIMQFIVVFGSLICFFCGVGVWTQVSYRLSMCYTTGVCFNSHCIKLTPSKYTVLRFLAYLEMYNYLTVP